MDNNSDLMEEDLELLPMYLREEDLADPRLRGFDYVDPLLKTPLIIAIESQNMETIKECINDMKYINTPDNRGNVPLHHAVFEDKLAILDIVLEHPHINVNCQNHVGRTPLLEATKRRCSDDIIFRLLDAGSDVNISNNTAKLPLHYAVERCSNEVVLELLRRGSNINAQDCNMYTPLHHAVEKNNLDSLNILLYHSADINLRCVHNLTPLMYAVNDRSKLEVARTLLDHYHDLSCSDSNGYTCLLLAANSLNPIAIDLVKRGSDINVVTIQGYSVLYFSIYYDNSELFNIVWPNFIYKNLLKISTPFLLNFLVSCNFPTPQWLDCLYKLLASPIIFELVNDCMVFLKLLTVWGIFKNVICVMRERKVPVADRLRIMYKLFACGAELAVYEFNLVIEMYGYNEELEMFIKYGDLALDTTYRDYYVLSTFMLGFERDNSEKFVLQLFRNQIASLEHIFEYHELRETSIVHSLGYFALSNNARTEILGLCETDFLRSRILEKLGVTPHIPTLMELSRNAFRKWIKLAHVINTPFDFVTAIKQMNLPKSIEEIILFKRPLYI